MSRLRIAMVGSRGLPAGVGGVERHVEEVGARLVRRGHEVTVFCRPGYGTTEAEYRGMRVVHVPTLMTKHLEALVHSGLSATGTVGRGFDVVHFHALGPGLFSWIPRLGTRSLVVQTIHGLDDQRGKWSAGARLALRLARSTSTKVPHRVIGVSEELVRVYQQEHSTDAVYIPNGHPEFLPVPPGTTLRRLGLEPGRYVMFLGRLVPEKDPAGLIRAFGQVRTDQRLVIVGGSSHSADYAQRVQELAAADQRIVLASTLVGEERDEVLTSAAVLVQPSLLEGLPLTLLEGATYGRRVVASDIPAHLEIVRVSGPGHRVFRAGNTRDLAAALQSELDDPAAGEEGAEDLRRDVVARYDWDDVVIRLERLYLEALST